MKLNSFSLGALVVFLLFGGIGVSSAMNLWQTESSKIAATYTEGEFAGQADPADIRGSYTFGDVNKNFDVPLEDLQIAFRIPSGTDLALFQVKELETLYTSLPVEIGTASIRMFVAFYKGLPVDLSTATDTYLFSEAADILDAQNKMLPEQAEFLKTHLVPEIAADGTQPDIQSTAITQVASTPLPSTDQVAYKVTGSTTFQNLLDWGVKQETIESVIGSKMPDPGMLIKDYVTGKGLEFSSIKTALQAEVDKIH